MKNFYNTRHKKLKKVISEISIKKLQHLEEIIKKTSKEGGKIIFVGNGGSAATASHAAVDFSLNSNVRSINFNEADLITCFANDFKYDNWVKKALQIYADKKDLLILISCSGNSMNLVNANLFARKKGLKVACLTGCNKTNKLNCINNDLNIWVNSKEYNIIEIIHHLILLNIVDGVKRKVF